MKNTLIDLDPEVTPVAPVPPVAPVAPVPEDVPATPATPIPEEAPIDSVPDDVPADSIDSVPVATHDDPVTPVAPIRIPALAFFRGASSITEPHMQGMFGEDCGPYEAPTEIHEFDEDGYYSLFD